MLVTVWATLALTALYPLALPSVTLEPLAGTGALQANPWCPFACMLNSGLLTYLPSRSQAIVGMSGLVGVALIKAVVERLRIAHGEKAESSDAPVIRNFLKGLTYVSICAWTFLLSQRCTHALLGLIR